MANNCLVTKLKGVVDNDDLQRLGEFSYFVENAGNYEIWFGMLQRAEIVGDAYFCSNSDYNDNIGKTTTTTTLFIKANGEFKLNIKDDYKLSGCSGNINHTIADFSFLNYRTINTQYFMQYIDSKSTGTFRNNDTFKNITGPIAFAANDDDVSSKVTGNISVFHNTNNVTQLKIQKNNFYGNISSISDMTSIGIMYLYGNKDIEGDTISFANMINLTALLIGETNIHGAEEELFVSLLNNGKTGELWFASSEYNTLKGISPIVSHQNVVFSNGTITISDRYGSLGVLATYNGTSWTYNF